MLEESKTSNKSQSPQLSKDVQPPLKVDQPPLSASNKRQSPQLSKDVQQPLNVDQPPLPHLLNTPITLDKEFLDLYPEYDTEVLNTLIECGMTRLKRTLQYVADIDGLDYEQMLSYAMNAMDVSDMAQRRLGEMIIAMRVGSNENRLSESELKDMEKKVYDSNQQFVSYVLQEDPGDVTNAKREAFQSEFMFVWDIVHTLAQIKHMGVVEYTEHNTIFIPEDILSNLKQRRRVLFEGRDQDERREKEVETTIIHMLETLNKSAKFLRSSYMYDRDTCIKLAMSLVLNIQTCMSRMNVPKTAVEKSIDRALQNMQRTEDRSALLNSLYIFCITGSKVILYLSTWYMGASTC